MVSCSEVVFNELHEKAALAITTDLQALLELAAEHDSAGAELSCELQIIEQSFFELELQHRLNGPFDANDAILTIEPRSGYPAEAEDWAGMLLRMYQLWAAQSSCYKVDILEYESAEIAGIRRAVIVICGPMAYGVLKGQSGAHRLVRSALIQDQARKEK